MKMLYLHVFACCPRKLQNGPRKGMEKGKLDHNLAPLKSWNKNPTHPVIAQSDNYTLPVK